MVILGVKGPVVAAFSWLGLSPPQILFTTFASLFAVLLGYSRVPYAAATDGRFFQMFGRLHPTKNFPYVSVAFIGITSAFACLLDLSDLNQIVNLEGHPELRSPPWTPLTHPAFVPRPGDRDDQPDVFAPMRTHDVLVHYPYQSFATSVERFVRQAVDDPNVLAIKMTVYRTSDDSALVPSLI